MTLPDKDMGWAREDPEPWEHVEMCTLCGMNEQVGKDGCEICAKCLDEAEAQLDEIELDRVYPQDDDDIEFKD